MLFASAFLGIDVLYLCYSEGQLIHKYLVTRHINCNEYLCRAQAQWKYIDIVYDADLPHGD